MPISSHWSQPTWNAPLPAETELRAVFARASELRSVRSPERDTLLQHVGLRLWYHVDDHFSEGWWYRWDELRVGSFPTIGEALQDALQTAPLPLIERAVGG